MGDLISTRQGNNNNGVNYLKKKNLNILFDQKFIHSSIFIFNHTRDLLICRCAMYAIEIARKFYYASSKSNEFLEAELVTGSI